MQKKIGVVRVKDMSVDTKSLKFVYILQYMYISLCKKNHYGNRNTDLLKSILVLN